MTNEEMLEQAKDEQTAAFERYVALSEVLERTSPDVNDAWYDYCAALEIVNFLAKGNK